MGLFGPSNPVFAMLKQDHAKVKKLFEDFERAIELRGGPKYSECRVD